MRAESSFAVTDFNISSSSLTAEGEAPAFGSQFAEAYRFRGEKSLLVSHPPSQPGTFVLYRDAFLLLASMTGEGVLDGASKLPLSPPRNAPSKLARSLWAGLD
jgi:hypothetical protein